MTWKGGSPLRDHHHHLTRVPVIPAPGPTGLLQLLHAARLVEIISTDPINQTDNPSRGGTLLLHSHQHLMLISENLSDDFSMRL
jgi:hypothetical protein